MIYFIGGSPCSGKSTLAAALAEEYGLYYFKVDDYLEQYLKTGASAGKEYCLKATQMSPEQIWMRPPAEQCREEIEIYKEICGYIMADLEKLNCEKGMITEGAAYLPQLAAQYRVPANRYISVTPTKEFQVFHYSKREWVPYVIGACSDREKAFDNWMERDALFAIHVQKQCRALGYVSMINGGAVAANEMKAAVAAHFGLKTSRND